MKDLSSKIRGKDIGNRGLSKNDYTDFDKGLVGQITSKADLVGGKIPTSQLPAVALVEFLGTVANQSAMLALTGQKGDWCTRSDTSSAYFIVGDNPTQLSSWQKILTPASPVLSVNGHIGDINLNMQDIGIDNNYTTTEKNKLASIATGATVNDSNASLRDRATHTGTQSADTITDGVTNKVYTDVEKSSVSTIVQLINYPLTLTNGKYINFAGTGESISDIRCYATIINDGAEHYITSTIGGSAMKLLFFYDNNNNVISSQYQGDNTGVNIPFTDLKVLFPNNCAYYKVNGFVASGGVILKKRQNMFSYLGNVLSSNIVQIPTIEEIGKYPWVNGVIQTETTPSRKYREFNISPSDILKVNTSVGGSAMWGVIYRNSSNQVVGTELQGRDGNVDFIVDYKLTIPPTATKMYLSGLIANSYSLTKYTVFTKAVSTEQLVTEQDRIKTLEDASKPLKDKKIVHVGTSIPFGGLYPTMSPQRLGGLGINLSVGSSMMRISRADGTTNGLAYANVGYCLMATNAEKLQFINDFPTAVLGGKPATLTQAEKDFIISCSFENRVLPYLDGRLPAPDYWAIDHGRNDKIDEPDATMLANPAVRNDRRTYIGAMNYLIDLILSYNPYAKIFIVGHYENTLFKAVTLAQQSIAERYNIPLLDMWNYTGFSQEKVVGSHVKWTQAPWNTAGYIPVGQDLNEDMTRLRYFCPDGIHPHSDISGKTTEVLIQAYTNFLKRIV